MSYAETLERAQTMVREAGYHVSCMQNDSRHEISHGQHMSCAWATYEAACAVLHAIDHNGAEQFINDTYKPREKVSLRI